jgi:hypothetical protein
MAPALWDQVSLNLLNVAVNVACGAATRAAVRGVGHNSQSPSFTVEACRWADASDFMVELS